VKPNGHRAGSLRTEVLNVGADRDVVDRGRIRGTASRNGGLGELVVDPELQRLIGNGWIRLVTEIQDTGTLSNRAGRNRGKAKHDFLYTAWR
jgi:hypothetical protein